MFSRFATRAFGIRTMAFSVRPLSKRFAVGFGVVGVSLLCGSHFAYAEETKAAKFVMISGGPGSGKGTQSELIVRHYGLVHVSTGDILRHEVKNGTPEGKQAKAHMDKGELVPQALIGPMVKRRLSQPDCVGNGFLLDGYPREIPAAEFLTQNKFVPDVFLVLEVPDDVLVKRLSGRVSDPITGITYHMTFFPPPDDPVIRKRLVQRSDDSEAAAAGRIASYKKLIEPVIAFYKGGGFRVSSVNGDQHPDQVFRDVTALLGPTKVPVTAESLKTTAQSGKD